MSRAPRRAGPVAGRPATWLEAGSGPPLLLVHGAGGAADLWQPQIEALADVARVLAPDLPGHGPGRGPQGAGAAPSIEGYAAWLEAFLEVAGTPRAVVVGHSMGGAVAQALALAAPDRLSALVLIGTGARLRVLGRLLDLLRERPAQGRELVQSLAFGPGAPAAAIALVGQVLREVSPLVTLGDYLACDRFDVRERLGAIRTPTLVLTGAEDRLTPLAYGRFLAAAIPGARLVEIPGAGHFPQLEQPAPVNRAVREFLAAVPPAPHAGLAEATRPPWT